MFILTKKITLCEAFFLPFFALMQRVEAGETELPILRELSYSFFLKASISNAPGLSIKLFDKIVINNYQKFIKRFSILSTSSY